MGNSEQKQCLHIQRHIVKAGWYYRNKEIHKYLQIKTVDKEIEDRSITYRTRAQDHRNEILLTTQ